MIQVGQKLPGIGGLFIAGIFAASLATMSGMIGFFLYANRRLMSMYMDIFFIRSIEHIERNDLHGFRSSVVRKSLVKFYHFQFSHTDSKRKVNFYSLPWVKLYSLSKQTEKQASNKVKAITVAVGILVTSLVFVVEQLGSIFQLTTQLSGLVSGSLLTMFTLGMTSRSANTKVSTSLQIYMRIFCFVLFFSSSLNTVSQF